jgi:hypothetical protein
MKNIVTRILKIFGISKHPKQSEDGHVNSQVNGWISADLMISNIKYLNVNQDVSQIANTNKMRIISPYTLILLVVLILSFCVRFYNLNYNSPFNDEAIYIVLGRMGIFQGDWWSYNPSAWVPGLPYLYPTMTAIAYMSGGIVGSRFLSVIFGVLAIEVIYVITKSFYPPPEKNGYKNLAGLISAVVIAGAQVSLYVSRLATFDMPSFYFFFLGIALLLYGIRHSDNTGKWYFLAAILLYFSFLIKIIVAIYFPLILTYSFFVSQKQGIKNYFFWKRYFLSPLLIGLALFFAININFLLIYAGVQASRAKDTPITIIKIIWENTSFVWIFWLIGSIGMLISKEWKKWLILSLAASWILLSHIISQRRFTLDKHVYLAIVFVAIIGGIGIAELIKKAHFRIVKIALCFILVISLTFYWIIGYRDAQKYNQMWEDATEMLQKLPNYIHSGNNVLVEAGASAILANYEGNIPTNTTTFDWLEYRKLQGEKAYISAMQDGYFDVVELDGEHSPKDPVNTKMHNLLKELVNLNYILVYSKNDFQIYQKSY